MLWFLGMRTKQLCFSNFFASFAVCFLFFAVRERKMSDNGIAIIAVCDMLTVCFLVATGAFCDSVQIGMFSCKNKCRIGGIW